MYVCCHIMTTLSWKVFPNVFVELKLFFRRWKEEKNSFSLDFLAWNCVTFSLYPMCLVVQIYFIGTAQQYPIPEFGNIDYDQGCWHLLWSLTPCTYPAYCTELSSLSQLEHYDIQIELLSSVVINAKQFPNIQVDPGLSIKLFLNFTISHLIGSFSAR